MTLQCARKVSLREDNRIVFHFDYDSVLISAIKQIEGVRWNPQDKIWSCDVSLVSASKIVKFLKNHKFSTPADVKTLLKGFLDRLEVNLIDSVRLDGSLEVLGLCGELRPFQKVGVEYMSRNRSTLLSDEMGTGKTIETIAAIEFNYAYPAIITCPTTLLLNWKQEIEKWVPNRKVFIFNGKDIPKDFDILILNYEKLKKLPKNVVKTTVVFDECHRLKNYKSQRTKYAIELAKNAEYRYLLSGTPMLNRPYELISQLIILDRLKDFGGFWQFANKYCDAKKTKFGTDFSGAKDLAELRVNLRRICLIRREKKDVLLELPEKQRTFIPVSITNSAEYRRAEKDFKNYYKENIQNLKEIDFKAGYFILMKLFYLRKLAAVGKLAAVYDWLTDFVETGKKLVVFVHHKDILHRVKKFLAEAGINVVSLCGDDSEKDRQSNIEKFQNGNAQIVVSTLKTGGEGITLTAASDVCFLEVGWVPSEMNQGEDRLHRIGQKDAVNCWYFKAVGTIEDYVYELLESKKKVVDIDDLRLAVIRGLIGPDEKLPKLNSSKRTAKNDIKRMESITDSWVNDTPMETEND